MSHTDIDRMIDDGCPNHQVNDHQPDVSTHPHSHHSHHGKLHVPTAPEIRRFSRQHKNLIHGMMIAGIIAAIAIEGASAKDLMFLALSIVVEIA